MLGRRRDPGDVGREVVVGITSLVHLRLTVGTLLVGALVASSFATGRATASCSSPAPTTQSHVAQQSTTSSTTGGEGVP